MKKLISITFILFCLGAKCSAQTIVTPNEKGIYKSVSDTITKKADNVSRKIKRAHTLPKGTKGAIVVFTVFIVLVFISPKQF